MVAVAVGVGRERVGEEELGEFALPKRDDHLAESDEFLDTWEWKCAEGRKSVICGDSVTG